MSVGLFGLVGVKVDEDFNGGCDSDSPMAADLARNCNLVGRGDGPQVYFGEVVMGEGALLRVPASQACITITLAIVVVSSSGNADDAFASCF